MMEGMAFSSGKPLQKDGAAMWCSRAFGRIVLSSMTLFGFCLVAVGEAAVGPVEWGLRAPEAGKLHGGVHGLEAAAQAGDRAAQHLLGWMLLEGKGVPQDETAGLIGVDPLSWTPDPLGEGGSRWPRPTVPIPRSSAAA